MAEDEKERQKQEEARRNEEKRRYDDINNYYLAKYFEEQVALRHWWGDKISFGLPEKFEKGLTGYEGTDIEGMDIERDRIVKGQPLAPGWYPVFFGGAKDENGNLKSAPEQQKFRIYYDGKTAKPIPPTKVGWAATIAFFANEGMCDQVFLNVAANPNYPLDAAKNLERWLLSCIEQGLAGQLTENSNQCLGNPQISSRRRERILNLQKLSVLGQAQTTVKRADMWMEEEQTESKARVNKLGMDLAMMESGLNNIATKTKKANAKVEEAELELKAIEDAGVEETQAWKDENEDLEQLRQVASRETLAPAEQRLRDIEKAGVKKSKEWKDAKQKLEKAKLDVKRETYDHGAERVETIKRMMDKLDESLKKIDQAQAHLVELKEAEEKLLGSPENVVWLNHKKAPRKVGWFSRKKTPIEAEIKSVDDVIEMVGQASQGAKAVHKQATFEALQAEAQKLFEAKQKLAEVIKALPSDVSPETVSNLNKRMAEYDKVLGKTNVAQGSLDQKRMEVETWNKTGVKTAMNEASKLKGEQYRGFDKPQIR